MKRIRMVIERIPTWTMTCIVVAIVGWLTLASEPVDSTKFQLFAGADKVVHALMFAGVAGAVLLDLRKHFSHNLTMACRTYACIATALLGLISEIAQDVMHVGRTFEWSDAVADTIGALSVWLIWRAIEKVCFSPDNNTFDKDGEAHG